MFQETDKNRHGGGAVLTPEPGFASIEADLGDTAAVAAQESSGLWEGLLGTVQSSTSPGGSQQGLCLALRLLCRCEYEL